MAIRHIKFQLEAKLKGTGGGFFSKPAGKLERKSYEDSGERLKVRVRNLKVPDHSNAVVTADGLEVVTIEIMDGSGKYDEEFASAGALPSLDVGQTIEVNVGGKLLLAGKLQVD